MSEKNKGAKKFINSSDKFLGKVADTLDTKTNEVENMELKTVNDYLYTVFMGLKSVKMLVDEKKKSKSDDDLDETNGKTLAERMGKQ